jgi:hypothetical protein
MIFEQSYLILLLMKNDIISKKIETLIIQKMLQ